MDLLSEAEELLRIFTIWFKLTLYLKWRAALVLSSCNFIKGNWVYFTEFVLIVKLNFKVDSNFIYDFGISGYLFCYWKLVDKKLFAW